MLLKKPTFWLALAGFAFGTLLVIRMSSETPQPEPSVRLPEKPFPRGIGASGIVEPRQESTSIGVPFPGLVKKMLVDVSSTVEIGQPLFQLDDRDLRSQLAENQAQVALKEAQLERATDHYSRVKSLGPPGAISVDELKRREFEMKIAQADLTAFRSSLERTKELIETLTVRSPIKGTVLQINIREGEYASTSSQDPLLILGDITDVWVRADIDEQVAPRVQPGMRATGYLKGDTSQAITLEFVRIEPFVIPKRSLTGASTERVDTRVLQIIYQFRNPPGGRIYVGQQMDLFIEDLPETKKTK